MKHLKIVLALVLAVAAASCAVEKTSNPLSPSIAGPIAGVQISAPKPLEPGVGWLIPGDQQPVTLLVENAYSTGPRPLVYSFEIATDEGFTNPVFARSDVPSGGDNRTALRLSDPLGTGRSYYWRAKAQDGANASPYSTPVNFDVFTPVAFDKPIPLSPVNNERVANLHPEFRFANAARAGNPGPVTYVMEVALNDTFATKVVAWQFAEQPSEQTRFTGPSDLPVNVQLFWHVRAFDSTAIGPWSGTQIFRTPAPVVVTPPSPTPSGGACSGSQPINIIECRRKQFGGHMSTSELLAFERAVAQDLNKAGIAGGPFGILRKAGGASCGGYSCDIMCAGQGTAQRQWDILGDSDGAQVPTWNGPHGYPNIRIDSCEAP